MKKNVLHDVEVRVTNGEIGCTRCECVAGHGPHDICKHAAAVLMLLHHFGEDGQWFLVHRVAPAVTS